ncbi:monovalent cation/H(+) antiporter subunit G [Glutamicibacter halophytocola]|uniref:cation:proton antiporter n=1 Tax=Glutamicibacter halophytocola TaxID=1933880 RepID=UPI00321BDD6E
MEMFVDILVAVLLIAGCLMSLIAGIGLLTFPDMLTRMHAATKPQVLGFLLIFTGLAIHLRSLGCGSRALPGMGDAVVDRAGFGPYDRALRLPHQARRQGLALCR